MPSLRPADTAWLTLAAAVLTYELVAAGRRDWELLSEAADRYRDRHPLPTHVTVLYLAGHLLRRWPARLDPLHLITTAMTQ
jgi:hypothetical protein